MTKAEKAAVIAAPAIAYYSGFGGIELKGVESGCDDYIIFVANAWHGQKSAHRAKVRSGLRDDSVYFMFGGTRIPLSECLRA